MGSTEQRRYIDLDHLRTSPEPEAPARKLTLVYERGDGTRVEYDCDEHDAWAYWGSAYELLTGRFESYDDTGSCYFVARRPTTGGSPA